MNERCARCGRFIGENCAEGVDWSAGMQQNGDVAWTGLFYCAYGRGCNRSDDEPLLIGQALLAEQEKKQ